MGVNEKKKKDVLPNVYCSTICNSQNMEAICMSINMSK